MQLIRSGVHLPVTKRSMRARLAVKWAKCGVSLPTATSVNSMSGESCENADHFFLGGVMGRPEFSPPYWYLAFFSDGFRICTTHITLLKHYTKTLVKCVTAVKQKTDIMVLQNCSHHFLSFKSWSNGMLHLNNYFVSAMHGHCSRQSPLKSEKSTGFLEDFFLFFTGWNRDTMYFFLQKKYSPFLLT